MIPTAHHQARLACRRGSGTVTLQPRGYGSGRGGQLIRRAGSSDESHRPSVGFHPWISLRYRNVAITGAWSLVPTSVKTFEEAV